MSTIRKFVTALAAPVQTVEGTIQSMIRMRDVRFAKGVWLDQLGNFVGQPRGGITDDEIYRRYVQVRVMINKSDGQPETLYRIARRTLGNTAHTLVIDNQGHAGLVMRVGGLALDYQLAKVLHSFLQQAASGGVRVILEFSTLPESETFGFEDSDGLGFIALDDPAVPAANTTTDGYTNGGALGVVLRVSNGGAPVPFEATIALPDDLVDANDYALWIRKSDEAWPFVGDVRIGEIPTATANVWAAQPNAIGIVLRAAVTTVDDFIAQCAEVDIMVTTPQTGYTFVAGNQLLDPTTAVDPTVLDFGGYEPPVPGDGGGWACAIG